MKKLNKIFFCFLVLIMGLMCKAKASLWETMEKNAEEYIRVNPPVEKPKPISPICYISIIDIVYVALFIISLIVLFNKRITKKMKTIIISSLIVVAVAIFVYDSYIK